MEKDLTGKLVLFIGPSGVGKGTVLNWLREHLTDAVFVLSNTTRRMRPGEIDGKNHNFITKEEFKKGIKEGKYLEWACVHGKEYYGILKEPVMEGLEAGKLIIREVDMQGFTTIRDILPKENVVSIFVRPESIEQLRVRILRRGKLPEEEIDRRLQSADQELARANECDYQVLSKENGLDELYKEVLAIIEREKP